MLVLPITCVYDVCVCRLRNELWRPDLRVTDDDHVWLVGREREGRVTE